MRDRWCAETQTPSLANITKDGEYMKNAFPTDEMAKHGKVTATLVPLREYVILDGPRDGPHLESHRTLKNHPLLKLTALLSDAWKKSE